VEEILPRWVLWCVVSKINTTKTCTMGAYLSMGVTRCVVLRVLGRGYRASSARRAAELCSFLHTDFRELIFPDVG
jgi:hypothetical protein